MSKIQWTDETWNPLRGCTKVSAGWNGTVRLVPEKLEEPLRWRKPRMVFVNSMSDLFHESVPFKYIAAVFGVMAASPEHTFQLLTKRPARMLKFFKWVGETHRLAGDSGWERDLAAANRILLQSAIALEPGGGIDRGRRVSALLETNPGAWPLPNVWLGVSVEDQKTSEERIPLLLQCPAAVRWISAEPLLGPEWTGNE